MTLRIRRALEDIQADYLAGQTKELDDLMRAWRGIKALRPSDPNSFFMIGGYHGEPFRGAGRFDPKWWGGYCNHANVLFPTWHRAYLLRIEDALRSIPGCGDVTLPFWDEAAPSSLEKGVPWALTEEFFELDGERIENPLRSFAFPKPIIDAMASSDPAGADYSKPLPYATVRYPLSGLWASKDRAASEKHNARWPTADLQNQALNANIVAWLTSTVTVNGVPVSTSVADRYRHCLDAPNYTVFSNVTSAHQWKEDTGDTVVPLEDPHNMIHLAVGGWDVPSADYSPIQGANGDMGENDTAALDPIFYFHHCFIDRMFWVWQKRHGATDGFELLDTYPGTNSEEREGPPTAGVAPGIWLTLDSPLDPFTTLEDGKSRPTTCRDLFHIENQLHYTYGPGSFDEPEAVAAVAAEPVRAVQVEGIDRTKIRGSFLISAFAVLDGKRQHVGSEAVLSRWHVEGCANCQTHLKARAVIALHGLPADAIDMAAFEIEVRSHDGVLTGHPALAGAGQVPFRFKVS
jgi:tyrosinase